MKKIGITSPNEADAIMMSMFAPSAYEEHEDITGVGWG